MINYFKLIILFNFFIIILFTYHYFFKSQEFIPSFKKYILI